MTQSYHDLLPLELQLIPMTLPEVVPQSAIQAADRSPDISVLSVQAPVTSAEGCSLLLQPGEASEILIKLENLRSYPLQINLEIEGNFPTQWCRIGTEGHEISPKGQMEAVLYFQPEADFFERDPLPTKEPLKIDYQGRVHVSSNQPGTDRQHIQTASFSLYLRPRSLYPNFLPEIYREIDFIGRLLKIFEQAFEPAVQTLDALHAHLNPLTAPEAMLPFLAHWVGWQMHPAISITRQRYLISRALELYRWRGTKRGLRFYLHLYTNLPLENINIYEVFGQGFVTGDTRIGQDAIIGGGRPYHFIVQLLGSNYVEIDIPLVHQIIEQEKPAFCTYELHIDRS